MDWSGAPSAHHRLLVIRTPLESSASVVHVDNFVNGDHDTARRTAADVRPLMSHDCPRSRRLSGDCHVRQ